MMEGDVMASVGVTVAFIAFFCLVMLIPLGDEIARGLGYDVDWQMWNWSKRNFDLFVMLGDRGYYRMNRSTSMWEHLKCTGSNGTAGYWGWYSCDEPPRHLMQTKAERDEHLRLAQQEREMAERSPWLSR